MSKKNNDLHALNLIVNQLEIGLGLNATINGSVVKQLPLKSFLNQFKKNLSQCNESKLLEFRTNLIKFSSTLSYLDHSITFKGGKYLDFTLYDDLQILAVNLIAYCDSNKSKDFKENNLKILVEYLSILEQKHSTLMETLSYKFIRIFILLLCMGCDVDAFITCSFVKNQFWINQGVNPYSKLSNKKIEKRKNKLNKKKLKHKNNVITNIKSSVKNKIKSLDESVDSFADKVSNDIGDVKDADYVKEADYVNVDSDSSNTNPNDKKDVHLDMLVDFHSQREVDSSIEDNPKGEYFNGDHSNEDCSTVDNTTVNNTNVDNTNVDKDYVKDTSAKGVKNKNNSSPKEVDLLDDIFGPQPKEEKSIEEKSIEEKSKEEKSIEEIFIDDRHIEQQDNSVQIVDCETFESVGESEYVNKQVNKNQCDSQMFNGSRPNVVIESPSIFNSYGTSEESSDIKAKRVLVD